MAAEASQPSSFAFEGALQGPYRSRTFTCSWLVASVASSAGIANLIKQLYKLVYVQKVGMQSCWRGGKSSPIRLVDDMPNTCLFDI